MDNFMAGFGLGLTICSIALASYNPFYWLVLLAGILLIILGFFAPSPKCKKCMKEQLNAKESKNG